MLMKRLGTAKALEKVKSNFDLFDSFAVQKSSQGRQRNAAALQEEGEKAAFPLPLLKKKHQGGGPSAQM